MLPRMRTIKECIHELKAADPQTAVTEYFLRDLINSGELPVIRAGRKILINIDTLSRFLENPAPIENKTNGVNFI